MKEEIARDIRKYFETKNENTKYKKLWDAAKQCQGKIKALDAYI